MRCPKCGAETDDRARRDSGIPVRRMLGHTPPRLSAARVACRFLPPITARRIRLWIYPLELGRHDRHEFTVRSQTGSPFRSTTADYHAHPFAVQGYSHWRNWAVALAVCSPGDSIVEVGANVGTETVGFSDLVGANGRVFAFEPFPEAVDALKRTLPLFRHANVTVFPVAVGAKAGRVPFVLPPAGYSGQGHLAVAHSEGEQIQVKCVTLDAMHLSRVDCMFVDAEGAEPLILDGARTSIGAHRPVVVLEALPELLARSGCSLEALYAQLDGMGLHVFRLTRLGLAPLKRLDLQAGDWLCLPTSRLALVDRIRRSLRRCGLLPCVPGLNPLTRRS